MSVVMVGLSHRSAGLDLVGKAAVAPDHMPEFLKRLLKSDHITEAAVLSTCMRTEVYVDAVRFHGAVADVRLVLAQNADVPLEEITGETIELFDDAASRHLFRVAAGLESAVVGEAEILGQVARAWSSAREVGASRLVLGSLFRHAVRAGKRARHETAISRGITSIGQAAVVMAERAVGGLADKRVLILGAGEMGGGMGATLKVAEGVGDVVVCNRTQGRAEELATEIGARAIPFDELLSELQFVDVLLTSTAAEHAVLSADDVRRSMQGRAQRPLAIVDMGLPRDVEESVAEIDNVTVLDLSDLESFADVGRSERSNEVASVEQIVDAEAVAYAHDISARSVVPVVRGLRDRVEEIRLAELERRRTQLDTLSAEQRAMVEALTQAMLAKVLHGPTVRLKHAAGTPEGERMVEAVRNLLDL